MKKTAYNRKQTNFKLLFVVFAYLLISVAVYICLFAYSSNVNAQMRLPLVVAPARQQITLDPGQADTSIIKFFNESTVPVAGTIKAVDYIVTDKEGSPIFLEHGEIPTKYSAASWIKLPYDRATIAAGTVLKIQFKINAPKNANPGGHYVAIMFEQTNSSANQVESIDTEQGLVAVSPRLVGLVNIKINGPVTEEAFVTRFTTPSFLEFGPVPVTTEILNKGDNHITPKGQIAIYDFTGRLVAQKVLEDKNIFPGTSRIYETKLGAKIMMGKFKVAFTAAYGDKGQVLSAQTTIWVFPWTVTLAILLGITIFIFFGRYIWNQLKKRQKKLEETLKEEIETIDELKEKYKDVISGTPETPNQKTEEKK